jgi:hypothetical protein
MARTTSEGPPIQGNPCSWLGQIAVRNFGRHALQSYRPFGEGGRVKRLLKQIVILLALTGAAYYVWNQRYRIADLGNNNLRMQGTWYLVEYDRKGVTPYYFGERIIMKDGNEWGSFKLYKNTELEVMVGNRLTLYDLSFPEEENMVWSIEEDGKLVPTVRWRE